MSETLVQVRAPHFTAGIILKNGRCVEAAPILAWAVTREAKFLSAYFKRKGWTAVVLTDDCTCITGRRDQWCPVHGRDPDQAYEEKRERDWDRELDERMRDWD